MNTLRRRVCIFRLGRSKPRGQDLPYHGLQKYLISVVTCLGGVFMSSLTLFSASTVGFQPQLASVGVANRNAVLAVQNMGNSQPSILARTDANTATSSIITSATASAEPSYLTTLRTRADQACFVDKNPQQCSYWNQAYASAEAARHFPGGEVERFREDAKKDGSLWKWFYSPTWTGPVRGTTRDVSSVAIVMSQNEAKEYP